MILTDADELRLALVGAEESLKAECKHSARLQREAEERHDELRRERDEARAEVERLRFVEDCRGDGLTYECNLTRPCVTCRLRTVAGRQREACAEAVKRVWAVGDYNAEVQAVRATPLVTEGE